MDNLITVIVLAFLALLLIVYIEVKAALRRMAELQGELDARLRNGMQGLGEPLQKIPGLEQRLDLVERNMAEFKPVPPPAAAAGSSGDAATADTPAGRR